jgi:hypothetical protein
VAPLSFVIVEVPFAEAPLTKFTAEHPGCTIDLISEPSVAVDGDVLHLSVVLIKGAPPEELSALLRRVGRVYDQVETLERDDLQGTWLGRMRLRDSVYVRLPAAKVITAFQHRFGAPWTHLEQGTLHLRARITDPAQGGLLVDQMRRYFEQAGVEAQVELRDISAKDYGVWEDLVQRAIGLSP